MKSKIINLLKKWNDWEDEEVSIDFVFYQVVTITTQSNF